MSDFRRRHDRRRAGRSGLELAEHDLRRWRREHGSFFWPATAIVIMLLTASFAVLLYDHGLLSWMGGAVAGFALCFLVIIRETGPAWIENRRRGAWAEQRTAKELVPLTRRGWVVLHDLPSSHGNLDHVAIGPPGVFVLDTKQRSGQVAVEGDDLLVTSPSGGRPHREPGRGANARAQGRELQRSLCSNGAERLWVSAVVVLWGDFPARIECGDRVTVVAGEAVVDWLEQQKPRYTPRQVEVLAAIARTLIAPETEVPGVRAA